MPEITRDSIILGPDARPLRVQSRADLARPMASALQPRMGGLRRMLSGRRGGL